MSDMMCVNDFELLFVQALEFRLEGKEITTQELKVLEFYTGE
jgi:hypothetical protein